MVCSIIAIRRPPPPSANPHLWCFSRFCSRPPSVHSLHRPTQQTNFLILCRSSPLRRRHTIVHIFLPSLPPRYTKSYRLRNTTTQISAWMTTKLHQPPMPKPFQNRIPHYWTPRAIKQINLLLRPSSDRSHFSCTLHFSSSQSRSHL